jgi:growth factor-regulated tyrosine kinase substrate
MMTRQHHCRGCGQVFCSKCSAKVCPIPKFGIEKEVKLKTSYDFIFRTGLVFSNML